MKQRVKLNLLDERTGLDGAKRRKLTRAYFAFLEVLFNSHMTFISDLDTSTFMHIVSSLESGLKGLDSSISTQCAAAIDNMAAFYFNNITMGDTPTSPAAINLARQIAERPSMFVEILKTLFEIVLFEDCGNQWNLSRPMLSLILISEQVLVNLQIFTDLKAHILGSQIREILPQYEICCLNFNVGSISKTLMQSISQSFSFLVVGPTFSCIFAG
ncbi:hypothetical protein RJ639_018631 [Escallonia herrerae]|uniref:Uncharacterized protein n=1 Tax=Escallonia herrerae TaxID=1293975 RepID=A0AA88V625_9ASTE|nr:hypothetical protein RJ639_018631 [Escallonia herrerae]